MCFPSRYKCYIQVRACRVLTRRLGELEVNEDEFPDHDEQVHGPMDTEDNKRTNPRGFIWDCCDRVGVQALGCESGQHIPSAKRRRHEHVVQECS